MNPTQTPYNLTETQKERLIKGVKAAIAFPLIDCIEDFIWEGVFSYMKDIPIVDPLFNTRSKHLYDVVDTQKQIGWSAKTLLVSRFPCPDFELVIQRANIFKKREELGFPDLNIDSPTEELGAALLKHWRMKVESDATIQGVKEKRICILLKSRDARQYGYIEEPLTLYSPEELIWRWTDSTKTGLQGIRKTDGRVVYRWYRGQTQFFEHFYMNHNYFTFKIDPERKSLEESIDILSQ